MFRKPAFRNRSFYVPGDALEMPVRGVEDVARQSPNVLRILRKLNANALAKPPWAVARTRDTHHVQKVLVVGRHGREL